MAAAVAGQPYTRADLGQTPDDGRRYELIDGTLVVSAAPDLKHQDAAFNLGILLRQAMPNGFHVVIGPFGAALGDDTELLPDVIVGLLKDFTRREIKKPALVVEVLSPGTRMFDTHVKRERFERAGVPSYWVVDPVARPDETSLVVWELADDGVYRQAARVIGEEPFTAFQPFPVTVVPADLVR